MKNTAFDKLRGLHIGRQARPSLAETLGVDEERTQSFTLLALDKIHPNPNQPRKNFNAKKMEELVLSIRERGVLMPIRVRQLKVNEEYEIIAGERRWRAATEIGLAEIPTVIVREQAPDQSYIDALIENVVREDLNAIDRAEALVTIRVNLGLQSWEDVGNHPAIGLSRQQIYNLLGLTSLPKPIQEDIRTGTITEKHGRALKALTSQPELLTRAWKHIKSKKLTGDQTLEYIGTIKKGVEPTRTFRVVYKTDLELITALEAKLRELREDVKT